MQDHIHRMSNPERWPCPVKDWYVLRRFSLEGTPTDSCSGGEYGSIANLNRHITHKHKNEGIPQQRRKYFCLRFGAQ